MRKGIKAMEEVSADWEGLRHQIDVQAVLDHYGAENTHEQTNTDGTTEIIHSCLLDRVEPHHANGDANPSAAANIDKKLYVCYSYWGGDIFHLIAKMERKDSPDECVDVISRFLTGATIEEDAFRAELAGMFATSDAAAHRSHMPAYSARILKPWAFTHPYVTGRGIDSETASRLQIGYDAGDNRITIPHFWGGSLVGYQKRAIPERSGEWPGSDPQIPKYRSSPGFPKGSTLYRYDEARADGSGTVIVVESPFSAIKAVAIGVSQPVVATFGAKVTDGQIELLRRGFDTVTVWMDDGDAGERATRRLVSALRRDVVVKVINSDPGLDLGDYDTAQSVQAKLDDAIPAWIMVADDTKESRWARRKSVSAH